MVVNDGTGLRFNLTLPLNFYLLTALLALYCAVEPYLEGAAGRLGTRLEGAPGGWPNLLGRPAFYAFCLLLFAAFDARDVDELGSGKVQHVVGCGARDDVVARPAVDERRRGAGKTDGVVARAARVGAGERVAVHAVETDVDVGLEGRGIDSDEVRVLIRQTLDLLLVLGLLGYRRNSATQGRNESFEKAVEWGYADSPQGHRPCCSQSGSARWHPP